MCPNNNISFDNVNNIGCPLSDSVQIPVNIPDIHEAAIILGPSKVITTYESVAVVIPNVSMLTNTFLGN